MRCKVLVTQDSKTAYSETANTDVEIWREATAYRTALATSGPRDVARYTVREGSYPQNKPEPTPTEESTETTRNCEKVEESEEAENDTECKYKVVVYLKITNDNFFMFSSNK